jgi:hypothetical protein
VVTSSNCLPNDLDEGVGVRDMRHYMIKNKLRGVKVGPGAGIAKNKRVKKFRENKHLAPLHLQKSNISARKR